MTTEQKIKDHERTLRMYGIEGLMQAWQVRHVEAELVGLRVLRATEKAITILEKAGQDASELRQQVADLSRVLARSEKERC